MGHGTELFRLIRGALRGRSQPQGLVIPYGRPPGETPSICAWISCACPQGPRAKREAGLALVIADVTEIEQARIEGQEHSEKLASEQRRLEAEKTDLEFRIKGTRRVWFWASMAMVLLIVGAAYYTWSRTHVVPYLEQLVEGQSGQTDSGMGTAVVRKQAMSSSITLSGAVEPFVTVNVLGPFSRPGAGQAFQLRAEGGKRASFSLSWTPAIWS